MMNFPEIKLSASIFWGLLILEIIIILALAMGNFPAWIKLILFTAFSIVWGILLSFRKQTVDSNLIQLALVGTISIFGIMFLIGAFLIFSGIKLGIQFASFLFFALLFLILFQLILLFTKKMAGYLKIVSIISLFIFSLYIIYDTNNILQRNYNGDFITASLDYYLDVLNIFIDLLNLFSSNT